MSWYPDLGTVTLIDDGSHVRAVGWLSAQYPFRQGDVPAEFLDRLRNFGRLWGESTRALGWAIFLGQHECEFCCRFSSGGNFGVPCGEVLYVAPDMLPHYVEEHGYRPPEEFMAAVMQCPTPETQEYRRLAEPFRRSAWPPQSTVM